MFLFKQLIFQKVPCHLAGSSNYSFDLKLREDFREAKSKHCSTDQCIIIRFWLHMTCPHEALGERRPAVQICLWHFRFSSHQKHWSKSEQTNIRGLSRQTTQSLSRQCLLHKLQYLACSVQQPRQDMKFPFKQFYWLEFFIR